MSRVTLGYDEEPLMFSDRVGRISILLKEETDFIEPQLL